MDLLKDKKILDQILDSFPCGIFLKDNNFNYLKINKYFLNNLGFNHEDAMLGKNVLQIPGPWTYDEACGYDASDRNTLEKERGNFGIITTATSQSCQTVIMNKVPLRNSADQIVGLIGMYIDTSNIQLMDFSLSFLKSFRLEEKINKLYDFNRFTDFLKHDFPNGIYVDTKNGSIRLSIQELKCIFLLFQNKTMETGRIEMGIAYKTFEEYIGNAKKKTGVNSRQDLIKLFQDQILKWFI